MLVYGVIIRLPCFCPSALLFKAHVKSMAKRKIRIDPKHLRWNPIDWSKRGNW